MQTIPILNLNSNPLLAKNGEAKYALNVVPTIDQKTIRNEDGFTLVQSYGGKIIGRVELPIGYVLLIKNYDTVVIEDTIYHRDAIICVRDTTKIIKGVGFNFNKSIKGRYTYNSEGELYITLTEGNDYDSNETRIINIDSYTSSVTSLSQIEVDMLSIIPNIIYPKLGFMVIEDGSILAGVYQFTISYKIEEGIYTNHSILSVPVYAFDNIEKHTKIGTTIPKSISINLKALDTRYSKFKLGIFYKGEDTFEQTYETEDIDIISNDQTYLVSILESFTIVTKEDILISSIPYIKDQDHVNFNGRLIRGNVSTIDYTGIDTIMQSIADNIDVSIITREAFNSHDSSDPNQILKHFKEDEEYVLYVGAIDYKGNFINAYPIYWKDTDDTEGVYVDSSHTKKIHKIPRITGATKKLTDLVLTLPSNVMTLLGSYSSIISSVCYFYAEHSLYTSRVLTQGFGIRDWETNNFTETTQTYQYPFASTNALRFYSLESLFNKYNISNVEIRHSKNLGYFVVGDRYDGNIDRFNKIFSKNNTILDNETIVDIDSIKYVINDNASDHNIAGESYHRIIFPVLGDLLIPDGEGSIIDQMDIFDISSKSIYLFPNVYKQNLVIASSIINISSLESIYLQGDFFYDNFTFRITGPKDTYNYGSDITLQDETHVIKAVIALNLESRLNLRTRYDGGNSYQKVFNINDVFVPTVKPIMNIPYKYDNFINTPEGKGYSISANSNGYGHVVYWKKLDTKYKFINRVIRSIVNSSEAKGITWGKFNVDDYKDFPIERGAINILEADSMAIYVQQEYALHVASIKDTISNDPSNTTYLGSSDLFAREPIEVMFDNKGYIGCDNRFSAIMTLHGYAVIDSVRAHIFIVRGTQAKQLDTENTTEWFTNNMERGLKDPYLGHGITLLFEDKINCLFISQNGTKKFTIHYNFAHACWSSFHSYIPNMFMSDRTNSYCISNNKIFRRNGNTKGLYFDNIIKPSEIVYIYNLQADLLKQILAIGWDTIIRQGNTIIYDITLDKLMIYNDTQCTGVIDVNENINWFDTETGVYKKDTWFFNQIIDLVENDKVAFIDANGNLLGSNLREAHDWFDENNFLCKFIYIKFGYDNKFTDINTKQKYSVPTIGTSQLEVIINSFDVNAIKSIR